MNGVKLPTITAQDIIYGTQGRTQARSARRICFEISCH